MRDYKVPPPSADECRQYLFQYNPRLRLGMHIAMGGAGVVYELIGRNEPCVVKFIDTRFMANTTGNGSDDRRKRKKCSDFIKGEIALMQQLKDCPHVMPLYDAFQCPHVLGPNPTAAYVSVTLLIMPRMYSVMQYIEDGEPLTESDILQMGLDIGNALVTCHRQNILHRDLKLNNIFVFRQAGQLRFVLGDFGVSRRLHLLDNEQVTLIGTPPYMAPEIWGNVPLSYLNADIFSLGVSMFYLLGHEFPSKILRNPNSRYLKIPDLCQVAEPFRPFLEKALQPNPEHRYHDPQEMLADLKKLCVTRRKNIIRDPWATVAKEALCRGKYTQALKIAREGHQNGEDACRRLLAYCLYREDPGDKDILPLLNECFMSNDVHGILIRGIYHAAAGDMENAGRDIQDAAENETDCVPAWYYFGRFLYYGNCSGIPQDPAAGLCYLVKAAEKNYYPALRILKRIYCQNPQLEQPASLTDLLKLPYSRNNPREREDIILYL